MRSTPRSYSLCDRGYAVEVLEEAFSETQAPLGFLGASLFRGLFENRRYGSCALALGRSKVGVAGWQDYYPPPKSPALFRRGFLGPGRFPDL